MPHVASRLPVRRAAYVNRCPQSISSDPLRLVAENQIQSGAHDQHEVPWQLLDLLGPY